MFAELSRFSQRFDQFEHPQRFEQKYIDGVTCINIICHEYERILQEDFSKQKDFINRFLEPVNFTFVESNQNAFPWQHKHLLKYKCHVSREEHNCDDTGCDDWYIVLTDVNVQLFIKYVSYRKVEFTKDDFIRIYTHFIRIFNVMRLAFTSTRSMVTLKDFVTQTPRWCERMRAQLDTVDTKKFGYAFSPLFSVSRFYTPKLDTLLSKCLLKKVNEDKIQRKQAIIKKVQDTLHMRAIPRILLMVPIGINQYAEYINKFICQLDLYDMMYQSKFGIPVLNAASSEPSAPSESLDPTDSEHSFMSFFSRDAENSLFYIVARRTRLDDPELEKLFYTHSKEARRYSMKKVFDLFFIGRNLTGHLDRINELTVYDSCHLTEETFKDLFDVYINVFLGDTQLSQMNDTNVVHLAYLAEFMGDSVMVYRIIDYFLGFRLEYLHRIWKADIQIKTDFDMPIFFKCLPQPELYGPDYGWDEDGRDA